MTQAEKILIIGAGGHARSCIDVLELLNFNILGLIGVSDEVGSKVLGHTVIGCDRDLQDYGKTSCYAHIGIGQIESSLPRQNAAIAGSAAGFTFPVAISPKAYVSKHAVLGEGTIVMHGAIVNAGARIGRHCIINTGALVEHGAIIGDFCHVATYAVLNGDVCVGESTFIGSGSIVKQGTTIGADCFISMGTHLTSSVAPGTRHRGRHR